MGRCRLALSSVGRALDSDPGCPRFDPREAANIDPWRNRNASVCKTVMSRGSTGRGIQDKQIARLWKETAELFHALVDQLDGQRISTSPYAGSDSSRAHQNPNLSPLGSVGDRCFAVHTQVWAGSLSGMTARFERAYEGSIPSSATNRSASREELLFITANRTVRNRYERPLSFRPRLSARTLVCGARKHGAAPGSGPVSGVKLKWTSAGLQNQRLQVRGLALRPFFSLTVREAVSRLLRRSFPGKGWREAVWPAAMRALAAMADLDSLDNL